MFCFKIFAFSLGATPTNAQGLFLALPSGIIPGNAHAVIWDSGMNPSQLIQTKCLTYCKWVSVSSSCCVLFACFGAISIGTTPYAWDYCWWYSGFHVLPGIEAGTRNCKACVQSFLLFLWPENSPFLSSAVVFLCSLFYFNFREVG